MELSVREAATLMGRSPRTVRAQLARGDLPGVKRATAISTLSVTAFAGSGLPA